MRSYKEDHDQVLLKADVYGVISYYGVDIEGNINNKNSTSEHLFNFGVVEFRIVKYINLLQEVKVAV